VVAKTEELEDPIKQARRLAQTHKLGPTYIGSGVCQTSEMDLRMAEDRSKYSRFSSMSLHHLGEMRADLDMITTQLEPIDIEAAMLAGK